MEAQQTPRSTESYGDFYRASAEYPEQLKYRQFGSQWAKKLYDDEEELRVMEKKLNNGISELRRKDNCPPSTTLDYPRILAKRDGKLYGQWMRYEKKLRTHTQDICLFSDLYKLPVHGAYASARLNDWTELFKNDDFGPTNESGGAGAYKDAASPDFVAIVGIESYGVLMDLAVNHIDWIGEKIVQRLRRWSRMGTRPNHIRVATLRAVFDAIACFFVPMLFTSTMFALARVPHLMVRIAVIGVFGLIFSASAMLLAGRVSRSSIFSLTAAYFAVASVFISTTGDNACRGR